jgi:hypothetical protein
MLFYPTTNFCTGRRYGSCLVRVAALLFIFSIGCAGDASGWLFAEGILHVYMQG